MTLEIAYFRHTPEVEVIRALTNWQSIRLDGIGSSSELSRKNCMILSGGKGTPCLFLNGECIAKGFFELVDWMRKEGHVLL